jgi:hypothetical protein
VLAAAVTKVFPEVPTPFATYLVNVFVAIFVPVYPNASAKTIASSAPPPPLPELYGAPLA